MSVIHYELSFKGYFILVEMWARTSLAFTARTMSDLEFKRRISADLETR